ncbi:IQ calmodulin-binding motif family protein [Trichomonas vaginalis G3]|uniref:IQ calmodulin-binding motif family protein n=1 Tax=Trichomonas vaginalis (strain ATCC PRA-98 / G3) TaxID=412133 RepID=A2E5T4_TRIV3|nr:acidic leucine-rich nuclear phosphoprotein 32 family [Trichomonas vaginalis G3]EAY12004.1 IQ calmodulin-binding motif family protein [Trichomonas vaginalis G3]KAI5524821.1 acidic leucine-rich nuclear phosphoprotein 32 family [Trichomonas vaginalis G3]|eukprot:XP_001324227.1 IQ calmodulin-binding motif family protein [Trichomonas vaginalis G3]
MADGVLTEEALYEAADTVPDSMPPEKLKYAGFSVMQFSDFKILTKCTSLVIIAFRSCGVEKVPNEFFQLPSLQKIDLSANRISTLPGPELWAKLVNLKAIDLSDNNISELEEPMKLTSLVTIRQINLTGNICLSIQDSFAKLCKAFPSLAILNDMIITSQYRAYLDNLAVYNNSSTLPLSKTDDFFFHYVKYMHVSSNERYIRKFNTEFFCLNRVLHRYSAAVHIQSVFRGQKQHREYKRMRDAALRIQIKVKYWYKRRYQAAVKIQRCFLYFSTRQQIKFNRSVRFIQSLWRRRESRKEAMMDVFDSNGVFEFYVMKDGLDNLLKFIEEHNFQKPSTIEPSEYEVIRYKPHSQCPLPGSPLVYFWVNNTLIVKKRSKHEISANYTIWCSCDHTNFQNFQRATPQGINWSLKCPFMAIQPIRINIHPKQYNSVTYPSLIHVVYDDKSKFSPLIRKLFGVMPNNIVLFPKKTLTRVSSQITIQSAFRMFIERSRHFKDMKCTAIEARASNAIRYWLKTIKLNKYVQYLAKMHKYYESLPETTAYYIPNTLFQKMPMIPIKYQVDFGFTAEKSVALEKSVKGFLPLVIPSEKIVFGLNDPMALVKFGTTDVKASLTNFTDKINPKWIKRAHLHRISFTTATEAKRRVLLFAWITGHTNMILSERGVLEYCAATSIQSSWLGLGTRRTLKYLGVQADIYIKMQRNRNQKPKKLYYANEHPEDQNRKIKRAPLEAEEAIARLRGDYRPTQKALEEFKAKKLAEKPKPQPQTKQNETQKVDTSLDDALPKATIIVPSQNSMPSSPFYSPRNSGRSTQSALVKSIIRPTEEDIKRKAESRIVPLGTVQFVGVNQGLVNPYVRDPLFETASPKSRTQTPLMPLSPAESPLSSNPSKPNSPLSDRLNQSSENLTQKVTENLTQKTETKESKETEDFLNSKEFVGRRSQSQEQIHVNMLNQSSTESTFLGSTTSGDVSSRYERQSSISTNLKHNTPMNSVELLNIPPPVINTQRTASRTSIYDCQPKTSSAASNVQSAQVTDNTVIEHQRDIFRRIVRLRQICDQVEQEISLDNSVQMKKQNAEDARERLMLSRIHNDEVARNKAAETMARNRIERQELEETIAEQKEQIAKDRAKKIKQLKEEREKKMKAIKEAREFGNAFISASRVAARITEVAKKQKQSQSALALAKGNVSELHANAVQTRELAKSKLQDLEDSRRRMAAIDRVLLEQKEERRRQWVEERLNKVAEIRRKDKEKSLIPVQQKEYVYIEPAKNEIIDPIEEAFDVICNDVGSNIGFEEGHILAEMIQSIL